MIGTKTRVRLYSILHLVGFLLMGLLVLGVSRVSAQTDIHITGAKAGFPVAVPQLCDAGNAGEYAVKIPELLARNLQISGIFKVLNPATFVESPGKCAGPKEVAYSDWSIVGAEGLVRGEISVQGGKVVATLYLHDVLQQRAVAGKRYQAELDDYARIAHRFSNEIMRYFTGTKGVFGSKIAYVSRIGRFKELFVMDLDGSNVRQLTRDKGLVLSPSWSPGGDRIVFTSYRTRAPQLYTIPASGGAPRQITNSGGLKLGAKFSMDGRTLLSAASFSGISKIALFDLNGKMLRRLTSSSAIDISPSWSPDGRQIAFCSNRAGGPQIYVMNADGSRVRRISFADSSYCTSPSWSPAGDKIAFVCRKGGFQIFIGSPVGGQAAQLTFSGNNEDPSWAPDGRFLVFSSTFGKGRVRNIAVLSLLGGSPTQISFARSEDSQPAWSPVPE